MKEAIAAFLSSKTVRSNAALTALLVSAVQVGSPWSG